MRQFMLCLRMFYYIMIRIIENRHHNSIIIGHADVVNFYYFITIFGFPATFLCIISTCIGLV